MSVNVSTEYLNMIAQLEQVLAYKRRLLTLAPIANRMKVLDVGCGNGADMLTIYGLAKNVTVVGVETNQSLIEAAGKVADSIGGSQWQLFHGNIMDCDPGSEFDIVRADRMLQMLDPHEADAAVTRMVELTKPGGKVVLYDPNWEFLDVPMPANMTELTDIVLSRVCASFESPDAGSVHSVQLGFNGIVGENLVVEAIVDQFETFDNKGHGPPGIRQILAPGGALENNATILQPWIDTALKMQVEDFFYARIHGIATVGTKPE